MEKSILDMWLDPSTEPLESIQSKFFKNPQLDLLALSENIKSLQDSMVDFWSIYERVYEGYRESMVEGDDILKGHIVTLNTVSVKQMACMLSMLHNSGISHGLVELYLNGILSESNLLSLRDPGNLIQSLLQYGNHIIIFKEGLAFKSVTEHRIQFTDPMESRMASRRLGIAIYELAHKTSNEVMIHSQDLLRCVGRELVGKGSNSPGDGLGPKLAKIWLSWAIHWALLEADSLYLYYKTNDLLKLDGVNT